jgi:predicted metalloprotease
VDPGPAKGPRPYDDELLAQVDDVIAFWQEQFPERFGRAFPPMQGAIYPAYPGRTDVPACAGRPTDYETTVRGNAFYCPTEDFIAYDDEELFPAIYESLGRAAIGVILAHELGHAVQARSGMAPTTATIILEQQADCYAGAWAADVKAAPRAGVEFEEPAVRNALLALIAFKDPIGANPIQPGAHGSGFDRVGAFQDGFVNAVSTCVAYAADPPPIFEIPADASFLQNRGDAPLDDPGATRPEGIYGLLITDLATFWTAELATAGVRFRAPEVVAADRSDGSDGSDCEEPSDPPEDGAYFCAAEDAIHVDVERLADLYERYGDFAIGYVVSAAYAEAVLQALGFERSGVERVLLADCLSGAYGRSAIPIAGSTRRSVTMQAGDLDEAVQTAVQIGDPSSDTDVVGSGFEKVAAFRRGVVGGASGCLERLPSS